MTLSILPLPKKAPLFRLVGRSLQELESELQDERDNFGEPRHPFCRSVFPRENTRPRLGTQREEHHRISVWWPSSRLLRCVNAD